MQHPNRGGTGERLTISRDQLREVRRHVRGEFEYLVFDTDIAGRADSIRRLVCRMSRCPDRERFDIRTEGLHCPAHQTGVDAATQKCAHGHVGLKSARG